jgi:hypothetical protein
VISVYLRRGNGATNDFDLARDFTGAARVKLRGLGRRAFYAQGFDTVYVLENPSTIFFVQGLYATGTTDGAVDAGALQSALVSLAGKASRRV